MTGKKNKNKSKGKGKSKGKSKGKGRLCAAERGIRALDLTNDQASMYLDVWVY
jgi:hypothetical protein